MDLIPKLKQWIREKKSLEILALYGFGSTFSDQTHAGSDIDLGILCERRLSPLERWDLQEELARLFLKDVDLVDLKSCSAVLRIQIIGKGKRLFCEDKNKCDQFETYAYSSYCHLNEERHEILQSITDKGSIYA